MNDYDTQSPWSWQLVRGNPDVNVPLLLTALVGIWLFISPFVLGFLWSETALWNNLAVGAILVMLFVWRFAAYSLIGRLLWWHALIAFWLVVSPFILTFYGRPVACWNDIICGIVVAVLAVWNAATLPLGRIRRNMRNV